MVDRNTKIAVILTVILIAGVYMLSFFQTVNEESKIIYQSYVDKCNSIADGLEKDFFFKVVNVTCIIDDFIYNFNKQCICRFEEIKTINGIATKEWLKSETYYLVD